MRSPHFLDPVTSSDRNWRVAVVCGGTSAEREISLQSGAAVIAALHGRGHLVRAIDPLYQPVREVDWNRFDVAFLALHGTVGEDGVIQRQLDSLGVPYTGSDAESSALAFHKVSAKVRFQQAGLPTPPWIPIREVTQPICDRIARQLGFPVAIKPVAQGSSLGVTIVRERAELPIACERALSYSEEGLAERAIPGEEWTVSLLDDEILGAIHIRTPHEFFDFDAKYRNHDTQYNIPPAGSSPIIEQVGTTAQAAARSLNCRGLIRVDLRVDGEGREWLLEVNTIPGLTSHSLVPKSAAALGWSLGELCERAIASAFKMSQTRQAAGESVPNKPSRTGF